MTPTAPSPLRTADVFVPGRDPIYSYNPRESSRLEQQLQDAVEDGGTIVSLTGPTKTGKTVLLRRLLLNDGPLSHLRVVWLDGNLVRSSDDFWNLIASDLQMRLTDQITSTLASGNSMDAGVNAAMVKASMTGDREHGMEFQSRVISPLAKEVTAELKETETVLVIDDFHFVDKNTQQDVIRSIKPLVFGSLRVVFASISHRWNDITEAVDDMGGRVRPISIPQWRTDELAEIATSGCRSLNVKISDSVVESMATMSFGSPHIMQHLCRELLRKENGIREEQNAHQYAAAPRKWKTFFQDCVFPDSARWFFKLRRGPKVKGTPRKNRPLKDGTETDIYGLILEAIASTGPKFKLELAEVGKAVQKISAKNTPETQQISRVLKQMSKIARLRINEQVPEEDDQMWNEEDAHYVATGSQPVLDYVAEDTPEAAVHISDPFFAYYLRWGSRVTE